MAILIATVSHDQTNDKAGKPYILHPLTVALRGTTLDDQIVGVLHDVIEDTSVVLNDLKDAGFSPPVVEAIDCLTRREEESYSSYINRIAGNPLARRVKIRDLEHNMDVTRFVHTEFNPPKGYLERIGMYYLSYKKLIVLEQVEYKKE